MWKELRSWSVRLPATLGILTLAALFAVPVCTAQVEAAPEAPDETVGPGVQLDRALEARNFDAATVLLDADVDTSRAVIDASRRGDVVALDWLFERSVDVDGRRGARALLAALVAEQDEAVERLRAQGADLDAAESSGVTLLLSTAADQSDRKRSQRMLSALAEHGADIDRATLAGRTALFLVVKANKPKSVRRLLEAGVRVDTPDRDGWTPLMLAARDGRTAIVGDLLDAGASPNVESGTGWTPLMWASWFGHLPTVERLLAAGADADQRTHVGGTALIRAVQTGRFQVVVALLEAGANPRAKLGGLDALGWARAGGRGLLLRTLRRAVSR